MLRAAALGLAFMATPALSETITWAGYDGPTTRYPHGVLGDTTEHTILRVKTDQGRALAIEWPTAIVFEDTDPLLVDLDADGAAEVLSVESHQSYGSRLSVYRLYNGTLSLAAATAFIGQPYRWMAKIGAADFTGDGHKEIALIDRPHLARTLRLYRYEAIGDTATLTQIAEAPNLSNHQIGWPYIASSIRTCGPTPEIITANANWSHIMATTYENGQLASRPIAPYQGPESIQGALSCTP